MKTMGAWTGQGLSKTVLDTLTSLGPPTFAEFSHMERWSKAEAGSFIKKPFISLCHSPAWNTSVPLLRLPHKIPVPYLGLAVSRARLCSNPEFTTYERVTLGKAFDRHATFPLRVNEKNSLGLFGTHLM